MFTWLFCWNVSFGQYHLKISKFFLSFSVWIDTVCLRVASVLPPVQSTTEFGRNRKIALPSPSTWIDSYTFHYFICIRWRRDNPKPPKRFWSTHSICSANPTRRHNWKSYRNGRFWIGKGKQHNAPIHINHVQYSGEQPAPFYIESISPNNCCCSSRCGCRINENSARLNTISTVTSITVRSFAFVMIFNIRNIHMLPRQCQRC